MLSGPNSFVIVNLTSQYSENGGGGFLNFNILEEHPPRRNIYWIESIRKQIFEYIYLKKIAILDFDLSGNPAVGELPVMEILNDSEIDDGRSTGLRQWNMNMLGEFLFKYV